jgi:biotin carboxylase
MPQTLAIIGASYLQLPLVLKARELGLRTLCFAWEEGAICKEYADKFFPLSVLEKEKIAEVCRQEQISGVTSIATDIAVPTIAYIAKQLALIGNSEHSAYISTNKYAMREALAAGGVHCPRFACVSSLDEAMQAASSLRFPLIIKPCDRSGSMGVCKLNTPAELEQSVTAALECSFCKEAVLEEFIEDAQEISIEGISFAGQYHLLAVTDKVTTGAPHYVELAHHQPSKLPQHLLDEAIRQTQLGVKALDIQYGASHSELMITADGQAYITEIGARMGGDFIGSDLVQLSTGYDFLKGVIEVALNQFQTPQKTKQKHSGVYFYSPETQWVKKIIENTKQYPEIVKSEMHEEQLKQLTKSADRAGFFVYQDNYRITPKLPLPHHE